MLEYMLAGTCIVATVFSMMARTNIRRWLGYNNVVDVCFTITMVIMFHGTFSGLISASFAGVVMSASLYAARRTMGYERIERVGMKISWVKHEAKPFPVPRLPEMKRLSSWLNSL